MPTDYVVRETTITNYSVLANDQAQAMQIAKSGQPMKVLSVSSAINIVEKPEARVPVQSPPTPPMGTIPGAAIRLTPDAPSPAPAPPLSEPAK